jgi:hypothetical protein
MIASEAAICFCCYYVCFPKLIINKDRNEGKEQTRNEMKD